MNIMDFNVKKLAADAGTFLSRAVQVRRRRLRPGWWRRGGRGEGWPGDGVARGTQACRWARPGAPAPPAVSASLAPTTAGPRPARRVGTRPRASSARDTLGSPRGGGLGAPAGEAGQSTLAPPPPFPALALALPAVSNQEGSFLFLPLNAEELPALFPPALSVPGSIVPRA